MTPTVLKKKRSPVGFPAALFAVGLGMSMYYGYALYRLPSYSEAEVAQSVDINLALDFQRTGKPVPLDESQLEPLRATLRGEIEADIAKERRETLAPFLAGLFGLMLAMAQLAWFWKSGK